MSEFLKKIQSADEETKKRWIIVSTIIIMGIVVYLWLVYFNSLVVGFSDPVTAVGPAGAKSANFTFWQTMKNGATVVYNSFLGKINFFAGILQKPREYIISPPQ